MSDDITSRITAFLDHTKQLLGQLDLAAIAAARQILLDCYHRGGRIYTLGNGGSASTAQHFACDLAKYVIPDGQRPFDIRCLTDNVSLYTAWANDAAREDVFANQMRGLITANDVVIIISVHGGSGFSTDLVKGAAMPMRWGRNPSRWWGLTAAFSTANALVPSCSGRIHATNGSDASRDRTPSHASDQGRPRSEASPWRLTFYA